MPQTAQRETTRLIEDLRPAPLQERGLVCTRMGAYKPRTNPYSFQGHGKACLPWVFELAGKYGIKVIAMEVTHDNHVREIHEALELTGQPTGVEGAPSSELQRRTVAQAA